MSNVNLRAPVSTLSSEGAKHIEDAFKVDSKALEAARGKLFEKVSFSDTILDNRVVNNLSGYKKTAAKVASFVAAFVATVLSVGFVGYKIYSSNKQANTNRTMLQNPTEFTKHVKTISHAGFSHADAMENKTVNPSDYTSGDPVANEKNRDYTNRHLDTYREKIVPAIDKAISSVVEKAPAKDKAELRRALYAAVTVQAFLAEDKKISGALSTSGGEREFAIDAMRQQFAQGQVSVIGETLASQVTGPKGTDVESLQAFRQQLEDVVTSIEGEAGNLVSIMGGGLRETNDAALQISNAYKTAVAPTLKSLEKAALERITAARDLESHKKAFLSEKKDMLAALSSGGEKGEMRMVHALQFLAIDPAARTTMGETLNIDSLIKETEEGFKTSLGKALDALEEGATFVDELESNFEDYVYQRELLARENIELLKALNGHNGSDETGVDIQALEDEGTTRAQITRTLDSLTEEELIDILRIVVGKEQTGSPTLVAAYLNRLAARGNLDAIFDKLGIKDKNIASYIEMRTAKSPADASLLRNGLKYAFTDTEALKELRIALGLLEKEKASEAGVSEAEADGEKDAEIA